MSEGKAGRENLRKTKRAVLCSSSRGRIAQKLKQQQQQLGVETEAFWQLQVFVTVEAGSKITQQVFLMLEEVTAAHLSANFQLIETPPRPVPVPLRQPKSMFTKHRNDPNQIQPWFYTEVRIVLEFGLNIKDLHTFTDNIKMCSGLKGILFNP